MKFELAHDKRNISDEGLLSDLRRVACEEADGSLSQRTYKKHGQYGVTTIIRRFISWNAAIEAAGLKITVERNVSDEKLFSALYDLWLSIGRQPSYSDVKYPECQFHIATYARRFGSWRGALEAFVSYANSVEMDAPEALNSKVIPAKRTARCPDLRLRFKVLSRDQFRCCACGASPAVTQGVLLEIDHIHAWSRGGETTLKNLQTLCLGCNQGKTNYDYPKEKNDETD